MYEKNMTDYNIRTEGDNLIRLRIIDMFPRENCNLFFRHHTLRISLVQSGRGESVVGDRIYPLEKGDMLIMNNATYHTMRNVFGPEHLLYASLHFEPQLLWANQTLLFGSRYLEIFFNDNPRFCHLLKKNDPLVKRMGALMEEIEKEFKGRRTEYQAMVTAKFYDLLVNLFRYYEKNAGLCQNADVSGSSSLPQLSRAMDYINTHLEEKISLETLAGLSGMSPSYFSWFFKKNNGIGLVQYVNRRRVQKALEYLRTTNKTVLEIGLLCGFENNANFYRTFRAVTGKTPSEYRK